ncbi:4Fe-4S binding protein [Polynucleobacter sp. Latsch14-2]|uniref:4Fe-4S binding protein n=1 Tax=Polynucleobacter sp. Latsch14-2 TaxID=2576920 RepID=UPI001C0D4B07
MSKFLTQQESTRTGRYLAEGLKPIKITYAPGALSSILFKGGLEREATCLRCADTPCALFSEEEVAPNGLEGFPADKSLNVCAINAINIDSVSGAPSINSELCFLCGVCASRCPTGAITLSAAGGAAVNDSLAEGYIESVIKNEKRENDTRELFVGIQKEGLALIESDQLVQHIFKRMLDSWRVAGDRFPNFLARNLLIGAGLNASVSRKGNNHMRMDIILSGKDIKGIAEVEFGQEAVLDAPRDILDALAILIARYDWSAQDIKALIISDVLPNKRSEYWHIIQDIKNVLNIKVGTVTIFTLMLANWMHIPVELNDADDFYIDRETGSYRAAVLEKFIGRPLNLENSAHPQIDFLK